MFVADSLKKSKQRFGEFEFEYFEGSDVTNKLYVGIFTFFSNFQRVQNKEVYIFRLSEANNAGINERPKYFKLYDAKDDLELSSLFPKDFDQAVKRLATDDEYYAKYFRSV